MAPRGESQFERAHATLREWILEGRYQPNDHLPEIELSQALNVSRTTTRSVLVDLNKAGYVVLEVNRGARVRSFTPQEGLDILRVRERLEGMAAALAAEYATDDEIKQLAAITDELEAAEAAGDHGAYAPLVRDFHGGVLAAARNQTLAQFVDETQYPLVQRQYRNVSIVHPRSGSAAEHRAIVVALSGRDPVAAEHMMRMHVSAARSALRLRVAHDRAGSDACSVDAEQAETA